MILADGRVPDHNLWKLPEKPTKTLLVKEAINAYCCPLSQNFRALRDIWSSSKRVKTLTVEVSVEKR